VSERIEAKTVRLITEGKVRVIGVAYAVVGGDSKVHAVEWDGLRWVCTCVAWQRRQACSHVEGVERVAVPPGVPVKSESSDLRGGS